MHVVMTRNEVEVKRQIPRYKEIMSQLLRVISRNYEKLSRNNEMVRIGILCDTIWHS